MDTTAVAGIGNIKASLFWSRVDRRDGQCWNWNGPVYSKGRYGRFSGVGAHRIAYSLVKGEIGVGLEIDHLCRNTLCVNPDHLEAVSSAVNRQRRYDHMLTCKWGHERTPENIYVFRRRSGEAENVCRPCRVASRRASYEKRIAASRENTALQPATEAATR